MTTVCWRVPNEYALSSTCSCGPGGCTDWETCSACGNDVCYDIVYNTGGGGGGGLPTWPIGGGIPIFGGPSNTGGGGSGPSIPPYYPCNPDAPVPEAIDPEPLPPCPPPGPGGGWQPNPMPSPCAKVASFASNPGMRYYFTELRNEAMNPNTNHESAYRFNDQGVYPDKQIGPEFN